MLRCSNVARRELTDERTRRATRLGAAVAHVERDQLIEQRRCNETTSRARVDAQLLQWQQALVEIGRQTAEAMCAVAHGHRAGAKFAHVIDARRHRRCASPHRMLLCRRRR